MEHEGYERAFILDALNELQGLGVTVKDAVRLMQNVNRSTIYRWRAMVAGKRRELWPEILLSARQKRAGPTDRQRIWTSMRVLREFTYADLESTAEVTRRHLRCYCRHLFLAGYLNRRQSQSPFGWWITIWRLTRNSGPFAPKPISSGGVLDINVKPPRVYGKQGVDDVRVD